MDAPGVLAALQARGATIRVLGDRLGVEPSYVLDDDLRSAIRAHREALFVLLAQGVGGYLSPPGNHCNSATVSSATEDPQLGDPIEVRERLGAVLIRSLRYGEVWIALDPCMATELAAEEAGRENPRPVLVTEDLVRLRGRSEEAVRAALEVARAFPGARVLQ